MCLCHVVRVVVTCTVPRRIIQTMSMIADLIVKRLQITEKESRKNEKEGIVFISGYMALDIW